MRGRVAGWIEAGAVAPVALVGALSVQWLPRLPPHWVMLATCTALVPAVALARRRGWCLWLVFLLGAAWAGAAGRGAMDARLPRALEGEDFTVVGRLVDLPSAREDATRFTFDIARAWHGETPVALTGNVQLNWYRTAPPLSPCERWRLVLRLKRPRGLVNPGTVDGERSALQRRIVATGYVREDVANQRLGTAWCVDRVRAAIATRIDAQVGAGRDAALLRALAVGDTRGLGQHEWYIARANGVSHLIAISGFHVGVAAIFGVWLVGALYFLWPALALRWPRPPAQAAGALLVAWGYSALAGFGIPTVRTLLMIAVVALARLSRRGSHGLHSLALALLAILAFDPLAVLAAGFWLSFVGVAFLMVSLERRGRGWRAFLHELTASQWLMTVALLPLTLWFFGQASLVGALSNLMAVPFVSFVIVPGALVASVLLGACPPAAPLAWWVIGRLAHVQWWWLERLAAWPGAHWYLPQVTPWALALALLGALWLFLPRGVPLRWLGLLLLAPLLWPRLPLPAAGAFEAWVLDVGQGLAVVVHTRGHALIYDTGPSYPSGFDLGEAVVVPTFHALGLRQLDTLIVSHADNDHAGGAASVVAAFPRARRLAGEPTRTQPPMDACVAGQAWTWDDVRFRVLNPAADARGKGNDRSCVLLVEGQGGRLLLTGDITHKTEPAVAAALGAGPPPVLVVPHHGSKTSSSAPFIAATAPSLAIISAGWRNRFGHPKPAVVARYVEAGVPVLNTADSGAIGLAFPVAAPAHVLARQRLRAVRYWRE
ncbi:MAG: DNA internalization-related competence protein ComEC/Rec2 [Rhodanobacter sp.]|nr:MAG: DNA internalization-related competence protein ComEC/Rec2 [Rhodanobacter sp.]TAM10359.1 MAG: DNA internalization-related competence protein ComEC/Rec2 [Rhodanobacter sp.]TAM34457.1 MAG: DNA internalization-related competence protein ComEC/Rec2 [Rhodanobacter sp.]